MRDLPVRAAEAAGVAYQMEVLERGTTDAAASPEPPSDVPAPLADLAGLAGVG